jgi:hypothetical protein
MKLCWIWVGAALATGACATEDAAADRRGAVISGVEAAAVVHGPGLLHAYVDDGGARLFVVPLMTGGNDDCQVGAAAGQLAPVRPVERRVTLVVRSGETVCVMGRRQRRELLWHLHRLPPQSRPMMAVLPW